MQTIQISTDRGQNWDSYECGSSSVLWGTFAAGSAVTVIVCRELESEPKTYQGEVYARLIRDDEMVPHVPLVAKVSYEPDSKTGEWGLLIDGRKSKQIG